MTAAAESVAAVLETPVGALRVAGTPDFVTAVAWAADDAETAGPDVSGAVATAVAQLREYFAGRRRQFDVPIEWRGVGAFQRRVLDVTAAIPYGHTRAYGQIATELGDPTRSRAVGGALKFNPIAVIVPCHRVVAADGALTGYGGGPTTGGRLDRKRALLDLEQGAFQRSLF